MFRVAVTPTHRAVPSPPLIERIKAVGEPAVDRREQIAGLHGYSLNDGWATTPTRIRLSGAKKWQAAHLACHKMITGELAFPVLLPSPGTQIKSAYDASPGSGFDIQSDLLSVIPHVQQNCP